MMDHKSKYFQSLKQPEYETKEQLATECALGPIESLDVFKQNPRLLLRLKLVRENNNTYEAHQLYKTIHFRCISSQLYTDCLALLTNGIVYFNLHDSIHCSFDLSKVFVETLKKSDINQLSAELTRQIKLIHLMLRPGVEERSEFSVAILKWSTNLFTKSAIDMKDQKSIYENYQKVFGHFDIHREFAYNFWSEKVYVQARYHFLHSLDAVSFAHLVIECHLNFGFQSECDLFLAQAVAQYLSLRNHTSARQFFLAYTQNHPQVVKRTLVNSSIELYEKPLINFLNLLLKAIETQKLLVFKYLDRAAEFYFNVRKPRQEPSGGILGNLMRMLTTNEPASSSSQAGASGSNFFDFGHDDEEDYDEDEYSQDEDDAPASRAPQRRAVANRPRDDDNLD